MNEDNLAGPESDARLHSGAEDVEGIPVRWMAPDGDVTGIALWLTHLGGSSEQTFPMLARLATRGVAAVTFDPPRHGLRSDGTPPRQIAHGILASFRQRMWPLLGQTVLESLRVLDWADGRFGVVGRHVAGGVSMGGDVAIALAGIDYRVSRVAGVVATPDWTRPRMHTVDEHPRPIDQGQADSYARWSCDAFNPIAHLPKYDRPIAIAFYCAGADRHVPAEAALRFRAALIDRDPRAGARIHVEVYENLSHIDAARDDRLYLAALDWLT